MAVNPIVLLVDDEEDILDIGEVLLSRHSCEVIKENSGESALKTARSLPRIDLIVTDLQMPGMDGIHFLRSVKELHPKSRRILCTGYIDIRIVRDLMAEDLIIRAVQKPINLDQAQRRIAALLELIREENGMPKPQSPNP